MLASCLDGFQDALHVVQDTLVCEADYLVASLQEVVGSCKVLVLLEAVDRSVDLNYESVGMAVEVDYESADRVLPAELETRESAVAQSAPEQSLGRRHLLPKLPSSLQDLVLGRIGGAAMLHDVLSRPHLTPAASAAFPSPLPCGRAEGVRG
jgi:hypothetical protein